MRIYLIGFMGSGKTTLGARVAAELQVPFLDTDHMIEALEKESIKSIFTNRGEEAFRKIEANILRLTTQYEKAIIATGGGLPLFHDNMNWLKEHGITMYLELPDEAVLASIVHFRQARPLIAQLTDDELVAYTINLLRERKPVYEEAAITLSMTGDHEVDAKILEKACKYIW